MGNDSQNARKVNNILYLQKHTSKERLFKAGDNGKLFFYIEANHIDCNLSPEISNISFIIPIVKSRKTFFPKQKTIFLPTIKNIF